MTANQVSRRIVNKAIAARLNGVNSCNHSTTFTDAVALRKAIKFRLPKSRVYIKNNKVKVIMK